MRRSALHVGPDTVCHIPSGLKYSQETLPSGPFLAYAIHYQLTLLAPGIGSQLAALGMVPIDLGSTTSNQTRLYRPCLRRCSSSRTPDRKAGKPSCIPG